MARLYDRFKTSSAAENEGQWFSYGKDERGNVQRVKLARKARSNKAYQKAMLAFAQKNERQLAAKTMSDEDAFDAMLKIFCDTIIMGWEYMSDADGEYMEFSSENAASFLRDLPDLYDEWDALAGDLEAFRAAQNEADAGN